jgi:acyl-CoA synthetase (AMP-forming)/AMP-acid ligase II
LKLSSHLSRLPNELKLVTFRNVHYTNLDLYEKVEELKKKLLFKSNDTVVLMGLNTFDLIISIIALDRLVKKIYFLPDNFPLGSIEHSVLINSDLIPFRVSENKSNSTSVTQWVLFTSGTTGKPKMIFHTFESLSFSCKGYNRCINQFDWILSYDVKRFAGLQVVLQSLLSGSHLFIPDDFSFESILNCILENEPNCISCTPSFFRKLLFSKDFQEMSFVQITLGGEIADESLLNLITKKFPTSRLIHIYASTEAGVGFSVKDKRSGFPKAWLENSSLSPIPMKISTKSTLLLKPKIKAKGDEIAKRTVNEFIDTMDTVQIVKDRVIFLGRENGVINIGGNKIHPEEVEEVIRNFPTTLEVKIYGKPSSILGQLLVAEIVLKSDQTNAVHDLKTFCSKRLPNWKVPSIFKIVSYMELSSTGKIQRL